MPAARYTNPHAVALSRHYTELDTALHDVASLSAELSWFDALDVGALQRTIADAQASRAALLRAVEADAAARSALAAPAPAFPARGATGLAAAAVALVPMGTVIGAMALAAAATSALGRSPAAAQRRRLDAALVNQRQQLATLDHALATHRATLARHAAFDRAGTVQRLIETRAVRDHAEAALARAVRDHATAEARLQPLAEELARAEAAEAELREASPDADTFQRQLGEAKTPAERGPIHGACAKRFGTSSPNDVIKALRGQLAGAERTTAKWRDRLAFETHAAAHVIDHLVIDGSNLCYAQRGRQRRFIGLVALEALVPRLAARYRVTVVFDASTRKRLDIPRSALEQRFGSEVEVHVATAARSADHTFLRYADAPTCWVVTNDQLRDFTDQAVVQADRILRYELLERMVEIPVLGVAAYFGG